MSEATAASSSRCRIGIWSVLPRFGVFDCDELDFRAAGSCLERSFEVSFMVHQSINRQSVSQS
jgi:hypothetical protein